MKQIIHYESVILCLHICLNYTISTNILLTINYIVVIYIKTFIELLYIIINFYTK
jgi:hypothetical protein